MSSKPGMLVLNMARGETIRLGRDVEIVYVGNRGADRIRIGFRAPKEIAIVRDSAISGLPKGRPQA